MVNPLTLNDTIASTKCLFLTYYQFWDGHAKWWLPKAREVAIAFHGEPNVSVGLLNCPVYVDYCETHKGWSAVPPKLRLYLNGEEIAYDGDWESDQVVDFLNFKCGTQRQMSGLLKDEVGRIKEADEIVEEFLRKTDQADKVIEKLSKISGAEFYVTVVKRFVSGGEEIIKKDIQKLSETLKLRKGSWPTLDSVKKRLNVFQLFAASPTPAPVEDCGDKTDKCTAESTPTPKPPPEERCSDEEEKCYPPTDEPIPDGASL
jgi:protein disulfide-isomerase A6